MAKVLKLSIKGDNWLDIINGLINHKEDLFLKISKELGKGKRVKGSLGNIDYNLKDECR